jgi:hypothetical protein
MTSPRATNKKAENKNAKRAPSPPAEDQVTSPRGKGKGKKPKKGKQKNTTPTRSSP